MTQVNGLRYTEMTQSRCTVVQKTNVQFPAPMAGASKLPVTLAPWGLCTLDPQGTYVMYTKSYTETIHICN